MGKSILIIRDEGSVANLWVRDLLRKGYQVSVTDWAHSLKEAQHQRPAVVVMDVSMPINTCLSRCTRLLRVAKSPVILLVDQGTEITQRTGIELLARPVRVQNLLPQINKVLEHTQAPVGGSDQFLQLGEICLDVKTHVVTRGDQQCLLPPKLFRLLYTFMSNAGRVLSRKELMKAIWDTDYLGDTRTLYVHVRWLREKIEADPNSPVYLRTVRGVGYRFSAPE